MRYYSSVAVATTLTAAVNATATTMVLGSTSGFPTSFPFTLIVDEGTANEEIVNVTALSAGIATVERGQDGTFGISHSGGAVVRHGISARDLREPQQHLNATSGVHGITGTLVGATDSQVLVNKTLDGQFNTFTNIPSTAIKGVAGGLVDASTAQTLTNKTIDGATITNGTITGAQISGGSLSAITVAGSVTVPNPGTTTTSVATKGSVDAARTAAQNFATLALAKLPQGEIGNATSIGSIRGPVSQFTEVDGLKVSFTIPDAGSRKIKATFSGNMTCNQAQGIVGCRIFLGSVFNDRTVQVLWANNGAGIENMVRATLSPGNYTASIQIATFGAGFAYLTADRATLLVEDMGAA